MQRGRKLTKKEREAVAEALSEVTIRYRKLIAKKDSKVDNRESCYGYMCEALEETKRSWGTPYLAIWHMQHGKEPRFNA